MEALYILKLNSRDQCWCKPLRLLNKKYRKCQMKHPSPDSRKGTILYMKGKKKKDNKNKVKGQ